MVVINWSQQILFQGLTKRIFECPRGVFRDTRNSFRQSAQVGRSHLACRYHGWLKQWLLMLFSLSPDASSEHTRKLPYQKQLNKTYDGEGHHHEKNHWAFAELPALFQGDCAPKHDSQPQ